MGDPPTPSQAARTNLNMFLELGSTQVDDEVSNYKNMPMPAEVVPMQWWTDQSNRFPLLSKMALGVLGTPSSSAAIDPSLQCFKKFDQFFLWEKLV